MKTNGWTRILLAGGLVLGLAQSAACSGPSPVASNQAAQANGPARPEGIHAQLHDVDGGPYYYRKFSPSLPTSPSFFPIGVWLAGVSQPSDITSDKAAGLNTYVTVTDNSNYRLVGSSGMYLISTQRRATGKDTVGWFVNDEADMWGGPGSAAWTGNEPGHGNICNPSNAACGYTIQKTLLKALPEDNRFRYANYGKGVIYWENWTQATKFIRNYQDVVSDDNYWFTDDSICISSQGGEFYPSHELVRGALPSRLCHLAANYALTVRFIRKEAEYKKPVWAFVELGHPSSEDSWPSIKPQQVTAAVWQSLIAGARGIIYFNHSFGGPCQTDNVLRDPCYSKIRTTVVKVDRRIKSLAPVLNAPFANNVVSAGPGVNISTKWYAGHFYVLAGSKQPGAQVVTFSMPCVGSAVVTVLDEGRTIRAPHGTFTDRFENGNSVHIYRIDGGSACGA